MFDGRLPLRGRRTVHQGDPQKRDVVAGNNPGQATYLRRLGEIPETREWT